MNGIEFSKKPTFNEKSALRKFGVFNRIGQQRIFSNSGQRIIIRLALLANIGVRLPRIEATSFKAISAKERL